MSHFIKCWRPDTCFDLTRYDSVANKKKMLPKNVPLFVYAYCLHTVLCNTVASSWYGLFMCSNWMYILSPSSQQFTFFITSEASESRIGLNYTRVCKCRRRNELTISWCSCKLPFFPTKWKGSLNLDERSFLCLQVEWVRGSFFGGMDIEMRNY